MQISFKFQLRYNADITESGLNPKGLSHSELTSHQRQTLVFQKNIIRGNRYSRTNKTVQYQLLNARRVVFFLLPLQFS